MLFESSVTAGTPSQFFTYDNTMAAGTLDYKRVEAWSFGEGVWDDGESFSPAMSQKDCPHLHAMDMGHKLLSEPTNLSHDTTNMGLYDDLHDDYGQVWALTRMFTLCECKDEELNPQRSHTSTHVDDWLASSASTSVEAEDPVGGEPWSNELVFSPWIFPLAIEDIDDDSPLSSPSMHSGYVTVLESPILSPKYSNEVCAEDIGDSVSCWSCTAEVGDGNDIIHTKGLGLTAPADCEKSVIGVNDQDTCVARVPEYELPIHCPKPTRAWEYKKLLDSPWPSLLTEAVNICAQMHFSVTY